MTTSYLATRTAQVLSTLVLTVFLVLGAANSKAEEAAPEPSNFSWQESIVVTPKLPPYTFSIQSTGQSELTIKISGGPRSYKGQTLTAFVEDEKRPGFSTCDINFDGYTDFRLVENRGATGNINYTYWAFNPKRAVFEEASEFHDITSVDEKKHLLVSHSKGGNIETITEYFGVKNGRPIRLRSIQTTWAREARDILPSRYSDGTPIEITRIYRLGKLHRTFFTAYPSE